QRIESHRLEGEPRVEGAVVRERRSSRERYARVLVARGCRTARRQRRRVLERAVDRDAGQRPVGADAAAPHALTRYGQPEEAIEFRRYDARRAEDEVSHGTVLPGADLACRGDRRRTRADEEIAQRDVERRTGE